MKQIKQKQTHKYREQTCGYQWGEESSEGQGRSRGLIVQIIMYKMNKINSTGNIANIL